MMGFWVILLSFPAAFSLFLKHNCFSFSLYNIYMYIHNIYVLYIVRRDHKVIVIKINVGIIKRQKHIYFPNNKCWQAVSR